MRQLSVRLILAFVLAGIPAASFADSAAVTPADLTQDAMRQAAELFYSVGLDAAQVYPITKAHLQRDRLGIDLEGGALVLSQPILGKVTGACYIGRARLALTPPTPTERASLKSRIGSEEFRAEVDSLYLRFNDATVTDLTSGVQPAPDASATDRCSKIFSSRNAVARKYEGGTTGIPFNLETDLIEQLLSPALDRSFFLIEVETQTQGWVTYLQSADWGYGVALLHLKPVGSFFDPEAWAIYRPQSGPGSKDTGPSSIDILHNEMEIVIPNRTEFTIDSLIDYQPRAETRTARLVLINSYGGSTWDDSYGKPVKVDSVSLEDGTLLPFLHRRHELLVKLPAPLPLGGKAKLRVKATERTIWQVTPESYGLLNTYAWFPQERRYLGGTYSIDWTVKVIRPLTAAGTGLTVREWVEKDRKLNCAQWKSEGEVEFPSLIFGEFKETRGEYKRKGDAKPVAIRLRWMPRITLIDTSTGGQSIFEGAESAGGSTDAGSDTDVESAGPSSETLTVPLSKPPQIVKEAGIVLDYYEQILGPYPNQELDIAQMAPGMWFGQAPPGLVQITAEYFLSQALVHSRLGGDVEVQGFLKTILAHEIAHHYWGDVVSWKSEQDQWLSESLAEYSAGLYLEASEGDKAFRQKRESWRKDAKQWEGTLPIIHASRASGENGPLVYTALLYNKGPLVLHMLRTQVGNDNFLKILKKVLTDYRGKSIDTNDFQAAAEAVVGYKLDWFFDQWVRGTGIPELKFSYAVEAAPGGKFLLKARLMQSDRANPKALFIPLVFQFEGDKRGQKEWRVKAADETLQLMLPEKPVKVLIDELGDLLAKIVYENSG